MNDHTKPLTIGETRLHTGLALLFGTQAGNHIPLFRDALPKTGELPDVLLCTPASKQTTTALSEQGYFHMRRYGILPSRESARWMLPLGNSRQAVSGLETFQPRSVRNSVIKALAKAFVRMDWPGWSRNTMLLASKKIPDIDVLTREVTGVSGLAYNFCLGTPGSHTKLSVQITGSRGEIFGYIKVPVTDKAIARVEHEARFLERLGKYARMRPHVPRVLHASKWKQSFLLFQTNVPGAISPGQFTRTHEDFLAELGQIRSVRRSGQNLVQHVGDYFSTANFSTAMRELGREALREASLDLASEEIECGIIHGDFAPWNTRVCGGKLYIYDWEMAADDLPCVWDALHFLAQTDSLLKEGPGPGRWIELGHCSRAVYLLYLLFSATKLSLEQSPSNGIAYRAKLLRHALSSSAPSGSLVPGLSMESATAWKDDAIV